MDANQKAGSQQVDTSSQESNPSRPKDAHFSVEDENSWRKYRFRAVFCALNEEREKRICLGLPLVEDQVSQNHIYSNLRFNRSKIYFPSYSINNAKQCLSKGEKSQAFKATQTHTMRDGNIYLTTQLNHDNQLIEQNLRSLIVSKVSYLASLPGSPLQKSGDFCEGFDSNTKFSSASSQPKVKLERKSLSLIGVEKFKSVRDEIYRNFSLHDVSLMKMEEIVEIAIGNKERALRLQELLRDSQESLLIDSIVMKLIPAVDSLCRHPLGNYLVQVLCKASQIMYHHVQNICRLNYARFLENEFSSRVIQSCIEINPLYRLEILSLFSKNMKLASKNSATVFVVSACIRACQNESEFSFFIEDFFSKPKDWFTSRWSKRILVSLVDSCSPSTLHEIAAKIYSKVRYFHLMLKDKYLTLVLLALLAREHKPTIRKLSFSLSRNILAYVNSRHFEFFLEKVNFKNRGSAVARAILEALDSLPIPPLYPTSSPQDFYHIHCAQS